MAENDSDDLASGSFECVEPALGDQMWQCDLAGTDPTLSRKLRQHLGICDACRLAVAVEARVGRGLADGSLQLHDEGSPSGHERERHSARQMAAILGGLRTVGTVALAAGLALMFLLPPLSRDDGRTERIATRGPQFLRPVEGEVLLDRTPALRWSAVPGATAYDLVVRGNGGRYHWQARTDATRARVPAAYALPVADDLLATLIPVPADLAPPQGISVSFRVGGLAAYVLFRLAHANTVAMGFAIVGLAALLVVVVVHLVRRRLSSAKNAA